MICRSEGFHWPSSIILSCNSSSLTTLDSLCRWRNSRPTAPCSLSFTLENYLHNNSSPNSNSRAALLFLHLPPPVPERACTCVVDRPRGPMHLLQHPRHKAINMGHSRSVHQARPFHQNYLTLCHARNCWLMMRTQYLLDQFLCKSCSFTQGCAGEIMEEELCTGLLCAMPR